MPGHADFNHGGFHRFSGQPLVRPGQAPPIVVRGGPAATNRRFGFEPAGYHRRFFGFGLPGAGIGVSFDPFDGPITDLRAADRPAGLRAADDGLPEGTDRVSSDRSGCRSETRMVASEDGGERSIRITWCRKG